MEYGRGTRGYAALKLREQGYKTVTSHIMYYTDLRSTCIYSTYNTRGMSNMQLKGGPHGAWAGACRTSSDTGPSASGRSMMLVSRARVHDVELKSGERARAVFAFSVYCNTYNISSSTQYTGKIRHIYKRKDRRTIISNDLCGPRPTQSSLYDPFQRCKIYQ